MKMRELAKGNTRRDWQIYIYGSRLIMENEDGSEMHWSEASVQEAEAKFAQEIANRENSGWRETDGSLSRRFFQHTTKPPGKDWIVWLDGDAVVVQFGKIIKGNPEYSHGRGQTKRKGYGNRNETLKAYENAIADRLVEGYHEIHSRETPYSHLGNELAEKKRAKAKVVQRVKTIPAAENLAKMLGEDSTRTVNTAITQRIDLDPVDWHWATWRPWTPLPLPEPEPFDRDACVARCLKVKDMYTANWCDRLQIPIAMCQEEAAFWFAVLSSVSNEAGPAKIVEQVAGKSWDETRIKKTARKIIGGGWVSRQMLRCLDYLIEGKELLKIFLDACTEAESSFHFAKPIRESYLPYRTAFQIKELRELVSSRIDVKLQPKRQYDYYPLQMHLGALLGCHKEIQEIVRHWQPQNLSLPGQGICFYQPIELIFGLGSGDLVAAEFRRLYSNSKFNRWQAERLLRPLLATTELRALDLACDLIANSTNKDECEKMLAVFALVKAPEAAPYMLELSQSAKSPRHAREWLETEVGNAIAGLIPVAAGKGKQAAAALQYLRAKKREGFTDLIAAVAKKSSREIADKIRQEVLDVAEEILPVLDEKAAPAWLRKGVQEAGSLRPLSGADFVQITRLPAVHIQGKVLSPQHLAAILLALQHSEFASVHSLLVELKRHADQESLAHFAWELFQQWLGEGAPSKQKWAMKALGILGTDNTVMRLTPLVRAWPGESQHARAVLGLECLRAIGSDSALMALNGIAQKLKFKGLKETAARFMEEIAKDKGLSREQLEDRIVPDCDLGERGQRIFDFGPRKFRFVLGPQLKPMIKDENGAVKTDLPKPNSKDDSEQANQAVANWKLLKKQVGEVAKIQAVRLEQAMVTGRRWSAEDFQTLLVRHPLMINLVRQLLWAVYGDHGQVTKTFRVTDDQTLADAKDNELKLAKEDRIGITHPLQLKDPDMAAWGEIFSDYEIVPPFQQLGRPIYALEKSEEQATEIARFAKIKVPPQSLVFGLEKLGWTRGPAGDAGSFGEHVKYFPGPDITAVVTYEPGMGMGFIVEAGDQSIDHCFFLKGRQEAAWYRRIEGALRLGTVDPVAISEVLGDLTGITAKGK